MSQPPKITRLIITQFWHEVTDRGVDYNGFNAVYEPGARANVHHYVLTIETDQGITGEYVGGNPVSYAQLGMVARYLIGKNALER
jgi:hypothetical protein